MTSLPPGWRRHSLKDVAEVIMGQSPPGSSYNEIGRGTPFFQGKAEFGDVYPTVKKYTTAGTKFAKKGDILMSVRAPVGPTNIAGTDCVIGRGLAAIRANDSVTQNYLKWILKHLEVEIQGKGKGTTFDSISGNALRETFVALPPILEQHQIVEILEDQLSRLDAALTYLELANIQVDTFEMSSINKAIESVPCEYLPLGMVIEKVEAGKSFTCLSRRSEPGEWGIIKVSAMTWGEFLPEENKAVPPNREVNTHNQIHQGDILVSRANTEKYVGAPVFVRDEPPRLLLSDKSLRLKPAEGVDPNWLITVLRAPTTRERISARSTGMKDSMRNISQKSLLSVEVPVPIDLSDQSEIVRKANEARNGSIQLRDAVEGNLELLGSLRRSLLQAAFTGQLTREVTHV